MEKWEEVGGERDDKNKNWQSKKGADQYRNDLERYNTYKCGKTPCHVLLGVKLGKMQGVTRNNIR